MSGPLGLLFPVSRDDPTAGAAGQVLQNSMFAGYIFDTAHLSYSSVSASYNGLPGTALSLLRLALPLSIVSSEMLLFSSLFFYFF